MGAFDYAQAPMGRLKAKKSLDRHLNLALFNICFDFFIFGAYNDWVKNNVKVSIKDKDI